MDKRIVSYTGFHFKNHKEIRTMRFRDLYDLVLRVPLVEHAFRYKEACDKVAGKADTIGMHVLKLIVFERNDNTKHWIGEIHARVREILSVNVKNKIDIDYERHLFRDPWVVDDRTIERTVESLAGEYGSIPAKCVDPSEIKVKLEEAMLLICAYLDDDAGLDDVTHFLERL